MSVLILPGDNEYRSHYQSTLANGPKGFRLGDGSTVPVFFDRGAFDHAFFTSTPGNTTKGPLDRGRAERMNDIAPTLLDSQSDRFAGWDKRKKTHHHGRVVCVAAGDFVVVVRMGLTRRQTLRGSFVTCYVADNSIGKIRQSPIWDETTCIAELTQT